MMRLRRLNQNFCDCFSQSRPLKSKFSLTNLQRLLPRLLPARPHYCSAHWIGSKLPVGNLKNLGCPRLRQWLGVLTHYCKNAALVLPARANEADYNSAQMAGHNFPTSLSADSTEPIGQNGLSCA